jgi:hypothetical protein
MERVCLVVLAGTGNLFILIICVGWIFVKTKPAPSPTLTKEKV